MCSKYIPVQFIHIKSTDDTLMQGRLFELRARGDANAALENFGSEFIWLALGLSDAMLLCGAGLHIACCIGVCCWVRFCCVSRFDTI